MLWMRRAGHERGTLADARIVHDGDVARIDLAVYRQLERINARNHLRSMRTGGGGARHHVHLVLEVVPLAGGAFSAQLVPQTAALLEKHGYGKSDLGAFAVVTGPGSFTGLRVGLAAVKGLADALQKPIVAVSLLEAVACSVADGRVFSILEARSLMRPLSQRA